jgi:hypothetical protein
MKAPTSRSSRSSRTSLLGALAALPLLSCGATLPPPLPPPPACPSKVYVPTGETTMMSIEFDVRLSDAYDFVGSCLLLDGTSLTTPEAMRDSAAHLRAGEGLRWQGPVSRDGAHIANLYAVLRGAGEKWPYRFEVRSTHEFVLTGDAAPALRILLREVPGEWRLTRRPTVQWDDSSGRGRPPG